MTIEHQPANPNLYQHIVYPILIVDDDPDYADILSQLIDSKEPFESLVATDVFEAMQYLGEIPFSVLIVDWNLPSWTGGTLLAEFDALIDNKRMETPCVHLPRKIPVIVISGGFVSANHLYDISQLRHFELMGFVSKESGDLLDIAKRTWEAAINGQTSAAVTPAESWVDLAN